MHCKGGRKQYQKILLYSLFIFYFLFFIFLNIYFLLVNFSIEIWGGWVFLAVYVNGNSIIAF